MADYPTRESHFAHKLTRLVWRTCAAQEIGTPAAFLVVQIAHTEDAKRYTGPVTYWNDQLQSLMGLSWDQLNRIRKKAIKEGWLYYEPGRKGKAGKYWTTIPPQYNGLPDGAVDEDFVRIGAGESAEERAGESADETPLSPHQCGGMFRRKPDESSEHSTLRPNPSPKPPPSLETSEAGEAADELDEEEDAATLAKRAKELLARWNATPGIKPARKMNGDRTASLHARMAADANWWPSVPIALERIAKSSFCRGGGKNGWVADIVWFLRPDTMNRILEGKYDDRAATSGHRNQSGRPSVKSIEA
jgi:hypothetical protein